MSLEVVSGWCATLPTPFLAIFLVVQSDRKISQRGFPWVFAFEKKKTLSSRWASHHFAGWSVDTVRFHMGMGQNHVALVNIKIGGKWMFIP